tara:strand:- start:260 stop:757 length:498 start_codon:yes stop_codon:yes gene_type:complete
MSSYLSHENSILKQDTKLVVQSKANKPSKELTVKQNENRKNLEEEKITTDKLKMRRNLLLQEMDSLIKDVKSWYAKSQGIYYFDDNQILSLIWKWDPESIRNDIFNGDTRIIPKAKILQKLHDEFQSIGDSHLTKKEIKSEKKAYINRIKTHEEMKEDAFYAKGN